MRYRFWDRARSHSLSSEASTVSVGSVGSIDGASSDATTGAHATPAIDAHAHLQDGERHDDDDDTDMLEAESVIAARDGGEVFPVILIGGDSVPRKQQRLRLRALGDDEFDTAAAAVERMANAMACRIADADDWATAEGYIGAISDQIRLALAPMVLSCRDSNRPPQRRDNTHTRHPLQQQQQAHEHGQQTQQQQQQQQPRAVQQQPQRPRGTQTRPRKRRPNRMTTDARAQRPDEALDELASVQRQTPRNQRLIAKARRRAGRVRRSIDESALRKRFTTNERATVDEILRAARSSSGTSDGETTTSDGNHDDNVCPVPSAEVEEHFRGVNAPPPVEFDFDDERGREFRQTLELLPAASVEMDALTRAPTVDDVEEQLARSRATSAPGVDGVGYDVLRM